MLYSKEHRVFNLLVGSWKLKTNKNNIQIEIQFLYKDKFMFFNTLYKEIYFLTEKTSKKAIYPAFSEFSKNGKYLKVKYITHNNEEIYTFEFIGQNSFKICSFDLAQEYEFCRDV